MRIKGLIMVGSAEPWPDPRHSAPHLIRRSARRKPRQSISDWRGYAELPCALRDSNPSDEPNEFSGWNEYRKAIIAMPGVAPRNLRWIEVRKDYLRARQGGMSHGALMSLLLSGEALTPYIGGAAGGWGAWPSPNPRLPLWS